MRKRCMSRADPRIFFRGGGGGGSRTDGQKTVWTTFFSPQPILQFTEGVQLFYNRESILSSKDPEGVQHFLGGGCNFFTGGGGGGGRGVQMLISIETHITCDFPGGGRTPYPPAGSALA